LRDIAPGRGGSYPAGLTAAGGLLFFGAGDGEHGYEPWISDGTPGGTVLLKDIQPGAGWSSPGNFTSAGDVLFFTATDGDLGEELWMSDGTPGGTVLAGDLWPGPPGGLGCENSYCPELLFHPRGRLFFAARDGYRGFELWALPLTGLPRFRRGDVDLNGELGLTDCIRFLNYQFLGGDPLDCPDAADVDDSGILDLTDAVRSLSYQFAGAAPEPEPPGPFRCGPDPTPDGLDCSRYPCPLDDPSWE